MGLPARDATMQPDKAEVFEHETRKFEEYLTDAGHDPDAFRTREWRVADGLTLELDWAADADARTLPVRVWIDREHVETDEPLLCDASDYGDTVAATLEGQLNHHFTDAAGEVLFERASDDATDERVPFDGWVTNPHAEPARH